MSATTRSDSPAPSDAAMECAEETIHASRLEASRIRQMKAWPEAAKWHEENARAAERWLVKAAKQRQAT